MLDEGKRMYYTIQIVLVADRDEEVVLDLKMWRAQTRKLLDWWDERTDGLIYEDQEAESLMRQVYPSGRFELDLMGRLIGIMRL